MNRTRLNLSGSALVYAELLTGPPISYRIRFLCVDFVAARPRLREFFVLGCAQLVRTYGSLLLQCDEDAASDTADLSDQSTDEGDPNNAGNGNQGNADAANTNEDNVNQYLNFSLTSPELGIVFRTITECTAREALALVLAVFVRDSLTYECLLHMNVVLNTVLGRKYLPTSKDHLWRLLGWKSVGIEKHAYCSKCKSPLGLWKNLNDDSVCHNCRSPTRPQKKKYFVSLSLHHQFKHLNVESFQRHLSYKESRVKKVENALEDILDGAGYKRSEDLGGILSCKDNISYTFNTDGFKVTKSSHLTAYPIFARINELPPALRQKHTLLCGLWVDQQEPIMNVFMQPFVDEANRLSTTGVPFKKPGDIDEESFCKCVPTTLIADAIARSDLLNQVRPTGYYGCPFCTLRGIVPPGGGSAVKFPCLPYPNIATPTRRTAESIQADMIAAARSNQNTNGFLGPSALLNLRYFDVRRGISPDDLHPLYLGVAKFHMGLLLQAPPDASTTAPHQLTTTPDSDTVEDFARCSRPVLWTGLDRDRVAKFTILQCHTLFGGRNSVGTRRSNSEFQPWRLPHVQRCHHRRRLQ